MVFLIMQAICQWRYVITGFLQNQGTPTRLIKLWDLLRTRHSSATSAVRLCPWNTNWSHEAEFVFRLSNGDPPRVVVCAYSWGAGWGAMELARQLERRGLDVQSMVLIDPVYRHCYSLGQWRALVPWSQIRVPANVHEVHWFRQAVSRPAGHDLVAESTGTVIHPSVVLRVDHVHMDDQQVCLKKCVEVAE